MKKEYKARVKFEFKVDVKIQANSKEEAVLLLHNGLFASVDYDITQSDEAIPEHGTYPIKYIENMDDGTDIQA